MVKLRCMNALVEQIIKAPMLPEIIDVRALFDALANLAVLRQWLAT